MCCAAVLDIWLPLAMGQRVIIAPTSIMKDLARVRDLICQHWVVGLTGVPSLLQASLPLCTANVWVTVARAPLRSAHSDSAL